jgi:hypothetical protein
LELAIESFFFVGVFFVGIFFVGILGITKWRVINLPKNWGLGIERLALVAGI